MPDTDTPKDRFYAVYITCMAAGCASLLPWNMFLNAIPYFMHQLRNQSLPLELQNNANVSTYYQERFPSYLSVCAFIPMLFCNIFNLFIARRFSLFVMFTIGSSVMLLMFLIILILVFINLDALVFLALILICVSLINGSGAFVQSSIMGIAAQFEDIILRATLEGQALAGIIATLLKLMTLGASTSVKTEACAFFTIGLVFLASATLAVLLLQKNSYFKYYYRPIDHISNAANESAATTPESNVTVAKLDTLDDKKTNTADNKSTESMKTLLLSVLRTMREIIRPGLCIFLGFNMTLMCFPALVSTIAPTSGGSEDWQKKFFIPVIVFLSFNVCDYVGRTLAGRIKWPRENQVFIIQLMCLARYLMVPFFMFMNQSPKGIPAVFTSDFFPAIFIIVLGLSNGYLITLGFIYGPRCASEANRGTVGVALSLYVTLGLASGVAIGAILLPIILMK